MRGHSHSALRGHLILWLPSTQGEPTVFQANVWLSLPWQATPGPVPEWPCLLALVHETLPCLLCPLGTLTLFSQCCRCWSDIHPSIIFMTASPQDWGTKVASLQGMGPAPLMPNAFQLSPQMLSPLHISLHPSVAKVPGSCFPKEVEHGAWFWDKHAGLPMQFCLSPSPPNISSL